MNVMWMLNRLEAVEMLEVKFTLNARSGSYIILLNCGLCCNFPGLFQVVSYPYLNLINTTMKFKL